MAKLLTAADARVTQMTRPATKQLWITGTMSPRAKKEIEAKGWQVHKRAEEQLLSWSEEYPSYQKPEEKVPDALVKLNFKSVGIGIAAAPAMAFFRTRARSIQ